MYLVHLTIFISIGLALSIGKTYSAGVKKPAQVAGALSSKRHFDGYGLRLQAA